MGESPLFFPTRTMDDASFLSPKKRIHPSTFSWVRFTLQDQGTHAELTHDLTFARSYHTIQALHTLFATVGSFFFSLFLSFFPFSFSLSLTSLLVRSFARFVSPRFPIL